MLPWGNHLELHKASEPVSRNVLGKLKEMCPEALSGRTTTVADECVTSERMTSYTVKPNKFNAFSNKRIKVCNKLKEREMCNFYSSENVDCGLLGKETA
jgi:hypothetical protein